MARRRQTVTIRHVAEAAGVSLQTVSRVINNGPNVGPAVKERVKASIERLGYVPSIAAQRMGGSKSYIILAINDRNRTIADWRARQGNDWVDQMLLGGMLKCAEFGYRMLFELVDTHSSHVQRELGATISALQPDGVILTPPHSENPLITGLLYERNIPFVRIGSITAGPGIPMTMGDEAAARAATHHLIGLGHERIGFVAGPDHYSLSAWRRSGWSAAMAAAGYAVDGLCAVGDFSFDSGCAAANALLDLPHPPTAIFASNDQMALGALSVANARGLRVPTDLSLISFDNSPIVKFTDPKLTAVDQPIAETFARAVDLLINHKDGLGLAGPVVIEGALVIRDSTAPAPSRNAQR